MYAGLTIERNPSIVEQYIGCPILALREKRIETSLLLGNPEIILVEPAIGATDKIEGTAKKAFFVINASQKKGCNVLIVKFRPFDTKDTRTIIVGVSQYLFSKELPLDY